jgi:hypothetical protein
VSNDFIGKMSNEEIVDGIIFATVERTIAFGKLDLEKEQQASDYAMMLRAELFRRLEK